MDRTTQQSLSPPKPEQNPMIDTYSFGRITINGTQYNKDLIIHPDHIQTNWWRQKGHQLQTQDIKNVLDQKPEILIIGTGTHGLMKTTDSLKKILAERGMQLREAKTAKACKIYNQALKEGKRVVAALHLTC